MSGLLSLCHVFILSRHIRTVALDKLNSGCETGISPKNDELLAQAFLRITGADSIAAVEGKSSNVYTM